MQYPTANFQWAASESEHVSAAEKAKCNPPETVHLRCIPPSLVPYPKHLHPIPRHQSQGQEDSAASVCLQAIPWMPAPQYSWDVYASGMFPPPLLWPSVWRSVPRERVVLICFFPSCIFFLSSYLCPQYFSLTVSVDSSSELLAGGFMTCRLTRLPSFSVSLSNQLLWSGCRYSLFSTFQRTWYSCKASAWCSVYFCFLIFSFSRWSWPPFALKQCNSVFPLRLDIVVVAVVVIVVVVAVVVCKLWQSALSQCAIFVWTRCTG